MTYERAAKMEREYDEWDIARALLGKRSDAIIKDGYIVFRDGYRNPYSDLKEKLKKPK